MGKLKVEEDALKPKDIMKDWVSYIRTLCSEDENMQLAIRRKGKSVKGCIAVLLKYAFNHQHDVDKDIIKEAGIKSGKVTLGIPGMGTAHKLIREYYTEEQK
jgi:hypothetical protein